MSQIAVRGLVSCFDMVLCEDVEILKHIPVTDLVTRICFLKLTQIGSE